MEKERRLDMYDLTKNRQRPELISYLLKTNRIEVDDKPIFKYSIIERIVIGLKNIYNRK